jgi:putative Holliday junction resolvase
MPEADYLFSSQARMLGFDYSQNKIGIAVGQRLTNTASGLTTLICHHKKIDWAAIDEQVNQWKPDACVVGLPLNMNGTEQDTTQLAKKFGQQLKARYHLPVYFMDERLTSREASQMLGYAGHTSPRRQSRSGKKIKKQQQQGHDIDQLAAQLILQDWLNQPSSTD